ncbi:hypothetical protein QQS21_002553 [Conoideocrella luteorostrata]|uniref:Zn(2)-C6 fungal-type domain-containing protein n=1 Tax=Conoideocrella luteorostrata TaxID=1105319 RepID=A0AAJ0G137_9HYPO|nr:hypothetical protein QQS21_002553 [Conoideocrella luteorostrata]
MIHESQLPRSCDRCHSLKERCRRESSSTSCERCSRLRLTCNSNRPFKRPGRRPQPYHVPGPKQSREELVENRETDILAMFNVPEKLSEHEAWLVHRTMADNSFIEQFLLGPSFCNAHRDTIFNELRKSPALLQDAYVACVLCVPRPGEDLSGFATEERINSSYRRASSALAKLRSLRVEDVQDLSSCLALGGSILTVVLCFGGRDSLVICSQVLSLIKPVYESQVGEIPEADLGFLTCLVMCETTECLLQTMLPTLQYRPQAVDSHGFVDRYVGLCGTLLPYLYDLCKISYAMLHNIELEPAQRLDHIQSILEAWRPTVPANFADNFTASEVTNILCQVHVMQQAALLIVHRLRHPFGAEQAAALAMANNILRQLETAKLVAGRTPRCIDFALMVACLEISDGKERSMQLRSASSIAAYSPMFIKRSESLLTAIWKARSERPNFMYWYHLGNYKNHVDGSESTLPSSIC